MSAAISARGSREERRPPGEVPPLAQTVALSLRLPPASSQARGAWATVPSGGSVLNAAPGSGFREKDFLPLELGTPTCILESSTLITHRRSAGSVFLVHGSLLTGWFPGAPGALVFPNLAQHTRCLTSLTSINNCGRWVSLSPSPTPCFLHVGISGHLSCHVLAQNLAPHAPPPHSLTKYPAAQATALGLRARSWKRPPHTPHSLSADIRPISRSHGPVPNMLGLFTVAPATRSGPPPCHGGPLTTPRPHLFHDSPHGHHIT